MTRLSTETWNQIVARMIAQIDHPSAFSELVEGLREGLPFEFWYAAFFRTDAAPVEIGQSETRKRRQRYIEGPYLLDPFYIAFFNGREPGCYTMREIAPPDFPQSRYYIEYYSPWGGGDEVGYLLPVADGVAIHLSFGRTKPNARFLKSELRFLNEIQPVIHEFFRRMWERMKPDVRSSDAFRVDFHFRISQAFRSFGTSVLTDREGEITHLLLRGHSAKSIARLLDISPGTVRNHMKSIYAKLEISSQSELFGLFFEALSNIEGDVSVDPLISLWGMDSTERANLRQRS